MTRWLDISEKYTGLREVAGPDSNPVILGWLQDEGGGKSWVKDDSTAWCGAFCAGVFAEAGMSQVIPKEPLRARSWIKAGHTLDGPRVGAIVVFPRGDDPAAGHVGLVTRFDSKTLWVRGGNQSDSVCVATFKRSSALGYRWPVKEKTPAELDAEGSRIMRAAKRQQSDAAIGTGTTGSSQVAIPVPEPSNVLAPDPTALPPAAGVRQGVDSVIGDFSWAKGIIDTISDFAGFVGAAWPVVALVVGGYFFARVAWDGYRIREYRLSDDNQGYTR